SAARPEAGLGEGTWWGSGAGRAVVPFAGAGSVPVGERGVAAGVGELLGGAVEVLGEQAPDDEVGAHVGPAAVLGAQVGYAGVAQDALADAADLLGDLLGGGVVGGGAQLDALEPLVADEHPGGGQGGLGGVALAAGPGGDDVGGVGGADVPVGPGEADDADQALGEELGDGEVQAPSGGAFGGGGLSDPGAGGLFGERLGHVGPGGDLLVVHHGGEGGHVVSVEGTQHQPLRADGDVGEGARHAPLRNLRDRRVLLNCPACSMKALCRTTGCAPLAQRREGHPRPAAGVPLVDGSSPA